MMAVYNTAIALYDWLISFDDEVELIWKTCGERQLSSLVYFASRYSPIIYTIFINTTTSANRGRYDRAIERYSKTYMELQAPVGADLVRQGAVVHRLWLRMSIARS